MCRTSVPFMGPCGVNRERKFPSSNNPSTKNVRWSRMAKDNENVLQVIFNTVYDSETLSLESNLFFSKKKKNVFFNIFSQTYICIIFFDKKTFLKNIFLQTKCFLNIFLQINVFFNIYIFLNYFIISGRNLERASGRLWSWMNRNDNYGRKEKCR